MEIKRTINLRLEKKGDEIICKDLNTLVLVMGTSSLSGNFNCYGIKKEKNKWIVKIEAVRKRIKELEDRKIKIEEKLETMRQIAR